MTTASRPRYYRKVIRIRAENSPNVRNRDQGPLLPGVLTYAEYKKRRKLWDKIRQCVGLDAMFYEGAEILLFPPEWLDRAHRFYVAWYDDPTFHKALSIGCDPGEGGAETAWAVSGRRGLLNLTAFQTPDTTVIAQTTMDLMREWKVPPQRVVLDRGGGGKQIADQLRAKGLPVRTVGFGEKVIMRPKTGAARPTVEEAEHIKEQGYEYENRRAQMYGEARWLLDPSRPGDGYALPPEEYELRRQLAPMPLLFDKQGEGRMRMLKKSKPPESTSNERTLVDILGCSPDRADAWVLSIHAMLHEEVQPEAGVF